MEKSNNFSLWIELGYDLFAKEGLDGIQVERLSRILKLNKSGFYHYFGDMEKYCAELVKLHNKKVDDFLGEVSEIKNLDPDYLLLLIKHAQEGMFQVQLTREKKSYSFYQISEEIEQKVNLAVLLK
ncbi:MAG TPA: TetR/AcrR family transcriptional regulator [Chryseolinea sp.]|nr:TetR/AcrR family transcriptional regulator [Chryseolinea sp.]